MGAQNDIGVVFFAKGKSETVHYGMDSVNRFISSYDRHTAGVEHDMVFAANGWEGMEEEYKNFENVASSHSAKILVLPNEGLDIGVYFRVAEKLRNEYLLFMNSNCEILADNYLKNLYSAARLEDVGIVGSGGSWEMPINLIDYIKPWSKYILLQYFGMKHIKRYKGYERIYKTAVEEMSFRRALNGQKVKFPNVHIRTSAFMIRRNVLLDYAKTVPFPRTKSDTYIIEHGNNSLTKYVLRGGKKAVVVGADGNIYMPKDWRKSETYRVIHQRNMMISEKQTRLYDEADEKLRLYLEELAWGE